jgi:hypothetical protein
MRNRGGLAIRRVSGAGYHTRLIIGLEVETSPKHLMFAKGKCEE